jgi:hypothetical protein
MKHVALFFVLGALLLAAQRGLEASAEPPRLVVSVPARADAAAVERAIDQAVLTDLALSGPALHADPIVREHLLRAMRGVSGDSAPPARSLERAIELGVHRADPVVRERLAFQGEQMLRAGLGAVAPTEQDLAAYLQHHAARYREPERVSFRQVFLARSRRGERLDRDAAALATRLASLRPDDPELALLSDPTILPLSLRAASERDIDARLGAGAGKAVLASADGRWTGPIGSAYGAHFVWIEARTPAGLPDAATLRPRLVADYTHDASATRVASELARLRRSYRIDVRRSGS